MKGLGFIELRDLSFEYKKDRPIINNLNLKIQKDEITAILGQMEVVKLLWVN